MMNAISKCIARCALTLPLLLVTGIVGTSSMPAQTFTILHTFTGPDGADPAGAMVRDAAGNLYGTTDAGGNGTLCGYVTGCGTVFKLSPNGTEIVLYSFSGGADGSEPRGLFRDAAGSLYGVTAHGGNLSLCNVMGYPPGCGVIFKLSPPATFCRSVMCPWTETVLHTFTGPDGALPVGSLIQDAAGNFYGATLSGGADQYGGTVFKINSLGEETVLVSFYYDGSDGFEPMAGVVQDSAGILYGTTYSGGNDGYGVIYKLDPATGQETVLHNFEDGDGGYPVGALVLDQAGNLYGATWQGGFMSEECYGGCGLVFKLDSSEQLTLLYSFMGGADGGWPLAGLIRDSAGSLYGTTSAGGNLNACYAGCGTVFKLAPNGSETVLYTFNDGTDGAFPAAALVQDAAGNLYGTTTAGGDRNCPIFGGCGVVFKITP